MKTTNLLLTLLFLLLTFTIKLKFAIAGAVLDTDGRKVANGGNYYILASFNGAGGGVMLATIESTHTQAVVQSASESSLGLPVSISNPKGTMVVTGDILNIKFTDKSSTWILVFDASAKVWYVSVGNAAMAYPSDQIKTGSFQLKEYGLNYKLVFCSGANTSSCDEIGIYIDSVNNRRLGLGGAAFPVKFKNANK